VRGKVVLGDGRLRRESAWRRRASSPRPAPSPSSAPATRPSWSRRRSEILAAAGKGAVVETYSADIADEASCKGMIDWLTSTHGGVDFLVNNAGRSIRRAIEASYDASTTSSGRCSSTTSAACA
jgi:NAD(P)-dependent dehydrogenase (short-subunit alcohol dehydrogenase family)